MTLENHLKKPSTKEIGSIIESMGRHQAILEGLQRFSADAKYFRTNYDKLRETYPDEFVGILHEEVVGHGKNLQTVVKRMRAEGIDTGKVYLHRTYFEETPPTIILYQN